MHRQIAVRLQILNRLLARAQGGNFRLQSGNVLDLGFELLDFEFAEC